ncbi:hypothetical protein [Salimicrobium flavidum]|uniref:Uncharacterized protein n=1 Tax=Salimicrobium flavidum TaxID=570947 RepID=A0A1N7INN0_9BACI|nr:hypothetical protein [Salimicrobium flavidum]SIS38713.1 hypothetical protein SAMN05421687_101654 [Salimicrobium flavidum]
MENTEWNLEEVQRLKKKRLLHYNLLYAIFFVLFFYTAERMTFPAFGALFTFLFWIYGFFLLYIIRTGKRFGPSTWRRINEFDQFHQGEKKWRRKQYLEVGIILGIAFTFTVFLFVLDFENTDRMRFPEDSFGLFGAWIGLNIGELFRIGLLNEEDDSDASE